MSAYLLSSAGLGRPGEAEGHPGRPREAGGGQGRPGEAEAEVWLLCNHLLSLELPLLLEGGKGSQWHFED